jgi:hypothetical protein
MEEARAKPGGAASCTLARRTGGSGRARTRAMSIDDADIAGRLTMREAPGEGDACWAAVACDAGLGNDDDDESMLSLAADDADERCGIDP